MSMPALLPIIEYIAPHEVLFLASREPDGRFVAAATCASIFTPADSWSELEEMAREAVQCHYGDDAHPVIPLWSKSAVADA